MRSGWKWFWAALLLLVASFLIDSGLLAFAMYVLLGVMLLSRFLTREGLSKVVAQRTISQQEAEVGDTVSVRITVTNTGSLPIPWLLLEDGLSPSAGQTRPPRLRVRSRRIKITSLRADHEVDLSYKLDCDFRGFYQIGPLLMESGDLFGLHRRHRVATEPVFLTVYPKVIPVLGYDIASRRPIGDIRLVHRLYEDPTRVAGVRCYESGDPLRRVHWRATARTGELQSKVYEATTLAGATILLDFHQSGYPSRGEPHRSELAVTTAASLAHAIFLLGQPVGLATNGRDLADRLRVKPKGALDFARRSEARQALEEADSSHRLKPLVIPTRREPDQFQHIRELLARVEVTNGLTFADFVTEVTPRLPRDASVIAVLPQVEVETALALTNLHRAGFAVSVVLVMMDPDQAEQAYARLDAQNIREVRRVVDESALAELCSQSLHRGNSYRVSMES